MPTKMAKSTHPSQVPALATSCENTHARTFKLKFAKVERELLEINNENKFEEIAMRK